MLLSFVGSDRRDSGRGLASDWEEIVRVLLLCLVWMAVPTALAEAYKVGPGDLLEISVWEVEDWEGQYRVDASGNLQLPLLGELNVMNKTLLEVREQIRTGLREGGFVQNPQVFLDIKEIVYKPIRVVGAVRNPGKIQTLSQNLYLLDVLAEVGGLLDTAGDKITIRRLDEKGIPVKPLVVSRAKLFFGSEQEREANNVAILPGYTIQVPPAQPMVISVLGEVNRQGQLVFSQDSEVTILRVLAMAGGLTDFARQGRITILRKSAGGLKPVEVDVRDIRKGDAQDEPMVHGDIVIVDARF